MAEDYRVRLTLAGPIATPLHSGTLFGHLCWALRLRDGEAALGAWLAALPVAPFLSSDAFPANCLPRPLLAPTQQTEPAEDRATYRKRLENDKALRQLAWITVEEFLGLHDHLDEDRLLALLRSREQERKARPPIQGYRKSVQQAHNTIDRCTGAPLEGGGLYFMEESWHDPETACELDVYVHTESSPAELADLFKRVGVQGFGRDASLGRGQFTAHVEAADPRLFESRGNRCLSLSHGVLSPNMREPYYRLHTHYGKLGGLYAGGARSPFKFPLLLTKPGATFSPADHGPYGALLAGVHPQHPEVVHNAWHLCLPFTAA